MNRFAKMKKERIYTLFETLSTIEKNTDFPVDPPFLGIHWSIKKESAIICLL